MIIRGLDANGDIIFGQGAQNYLTGQAALALNIKTRLLSFLNNCVWDMSSGIDWLTFLRNPGNEAQVVLAVKTVILKSAGVLQVNQVSVNTSGRSLSLSYNINTIYTSNFSATLQSLQEIMINADL